MAMSCTICDVPISPKETRHALKMRYSYYEMYCRDIGEPVQRRKHLFCPEHTTAFVTWIKEQLDESETVDEGSIDQPGHSS